MYTVSTCLRPCPPQQQVPGRGLPNPGTGECSPRCQPRAPTKPVRLDKAFAGRIAFCANYVEVGSCGGNAAGHPEVEPHPPPQQGRICALEGENAAGVKANRWRFSRGGLVGPSAAAGCKHVGRPFLQKRHGCRPRRLYLLQQCVPICWILNVTDYESGLARSLGSLAPATASSIVNAGAGALPVDVFLGQGKEGYTPPPCDVSFHSRSPQSR